MSYEPFYAVNSYRMAITNTSSVLEVLEGSNIRICNIGTENAYVWLGGLDAVADNTKICLMPGACEIFNRGPGIKTHLAAIAETSASTLSVQSGEGA